MGFKEDLQQFKDFLNIIRGREDSRERFSFYLEPANIKTTSRCNSSQVEFAADSYTATEYYPEFSPLQQLAKQVLEVMISHKGAGREEVIKFQQASKGQPGTQVGIFQSLKEKIKKPKEEKTE